MAAQKDIDQSKGYDYGCVGGAVTVQGQKVNGSNVRATSQPAAVADTVDEPTMTLHDCSLENPSGPPGAEEFIENDIQGGVAFCMVWGQNGSPVNGRWETDAIGEDYVDLQINQHRHQIIFATSDWQDSPYTTLTGVSTLDREKFGFVPEQVDITAWSTDSFDNVDDLYVGTPFVDGRVYSIQIGALHVTVTNKAFDMVLGQPGKVATARFRCQTNDFDQSYCEWPDGEEAALPIG